MSLQLPQGINKLCYSFLCGSCRHCNRTLLIVHNGACEYCYAEYEQCIGCPDKHHRGNICWHLLSLNPVPSLLENPSWYDLSYLYVWEYLSRI